MNALARMDLSWSGRASFWLMAVHATLLIRHMSSVLLRFHRSITPTRQFQYRSEVAEHLVKNAAFPYHGWRPCFASLWLMAVQLADGRAHIE